MIKAWDIVIWKDVMSEKQYVSRVLEVYKCESSDVVDYLCEPQFIYDYNVEEVYKKEMLGGINE